MNTAQDEDDDEEGVKLPGLPANAPNYMTPECYRRMLDERENLVRTERPQRGHGPQAQPGVHHH